ncbi:hypothetical protein CfE428DRAFT_4178 [Chthoniobacter flavus Ellin428]|uniref:Uncharacterized protein n=1 Tax=Chthoniobacter flavus Ellin428 TaxID=497964 RepID=B4D5I9_9BACT|nr:hypothetical protein CfE428DRAFT_4178 [Chthoniobacter flavus Ellin428]
MSKDWWRAAMKRFQNVRLGAAIPPWRDRRPEQTRGTPFLGRRSATQGDWKVARPNQGHRLPTLSLNRPVVNPLEHRGFAFPRAVWIDHEDSIRAEARP